MVDFQMMEIRCTMSEREKVKNTRCKRFSFQEIGCLWCVMIMGANTAVDELIERFSKFKNKTKRQMETNDLHLWIGFVLGNLARIFGRKSSMAIRMSFVSCDYRPYDAHTCKNDAHKIFHMSGYTCNNGRMLICVCMIWNLFNCWPVCIKRFATVTNYL